MNRLFIAALNIENRISVSESVADEMQKEKWADGGRRRDVFIEHSKKVRKTQNWLKLAMKVRCFDEDDDVNTFKCTTGDDQKEKEDAQRYS